MVQNTKQRGAISMHVRWMKDMKEERTVSIILFKAPMNKTDIYKWEAPVSVYK